MNRGEAATSAVLRWMVEITTHQPKGTGRSKPAGVGQV